MKISILHYILTCFVIFSANAQNESKIIKVDNFKSKFVKERNIEIWLPKAYFDDNAQQFPVIYINDGQNVFDANTSTSGAAIEADAAADKLIGDETVSPFIIVAIWSTDKRSLEYFPEKSAQYFSKQDVEEVGGAWDIKNLKTTDFLGDEYLKFITAELKPYIDKNYRTLKEAEHTSIAGFSMGGLISLYAICEYPQIFGQAACISTHWPLLFDNSNMEPSEAVRKYIEETLPDPENHRIYFDHGDKGLDQYYEVHQQMVDRMMENKGYIKGYNWQTEKFEGAEHHEKYIKERIDNVFKFLVPLSVRE